MKRYTLIMAQALQLDLGQSGGDYAYRLRANVSSSVNGGFYIEDAVSGNDLYRTVSGTSGYQCFLY